jgi:hypothetical protein
MLRARKVKEEESRANGSQGGLVFHSWMSHIGVGKQGLVLMEFS